MLYGCPTVRDPSCLPSPPAHPGHVSEAEHLASKINSSRKSGLDLAVTLWIQLSDRTPPFKLDPAEATGVLWVAMHDINEHAVAWDRVSVSLPRYLPPLKRVMPSKAVRTWLGIQTMRVASIPLHELAPAEAVSFGPSRKPGVTAPADPLHHTQLHFNLWGLTLHVLTDVSTRGGAATRSLQWPYATSPSPVVTLLILALTGAVDVCTGFKRGVFPAHLAALAGVASVTAAVGWWAFL